MVGKLVVYFEAIMKGYVRIPRCCEQREQVELEELQKIINNNNNNKDMG